LIIAVLVVSGAAIFYFFFWNSPDKSGRVLEIRDSASGRLYGKWPLDENGEFSVEFVHSVHRSPVRETFAIDGGLIRPRMTRFSSFGAGMQSDVEEGQTLTMDGDSMILSGFRSSFIELNYIVGTDSDHLLFVNEEIYSLRKMCGRNAAITIRAK